MARKQNGGKLAGKKVAFVGRFNDYFVGKYHDRVADAGGTVVESGQSPDYLVCGQGRGGKPPGDVARLQKKLPGLRTFDLAGFFRLLVPDRDELLRMIDAKGFDVPSPSESTGWDRLLEMMFWADAYLDLSGVDLRDRDLYAAKLERMTLDGADLRGAKMQYAHFGHLRHVNLDRIDGPNVYLTDATDCTFREANLERVWGFWGAGKLVERCDFTAARMPHARLQSYQGVVRDCTFHRADLSAAEMERTAFERADFRDADLTGIQACGARFVGADFRGAKLGRADLRNAVLAGADLRDADLRDATLNEADLTGAKVDGADFTGAALGGANLAGVEVVKALNLGPPVVRQAGPHLLALADVAAGAKRFETAAEVDLGGGEFAKLELFRQTRDGVATAHARSDHYRDGDRVCNWLAAPTFERGMLNLADRWPNATLRLDTVTAKGGRTPPRKLLGLAVAAWSEAFGVRKSADELAGEQYEQAEAARAELAALVARIRAEGVAAWEEIDFRLRDRYVDFTGADLRDLALDGIDLSRKTLAGCRFEQASLVGSNLNCSDLRDAELSGANLHGASAYQADFRGARLVGTLASNAVLDSANLARADLTGADLTDANLTRAILDGTDLTGATMTAGTRLGGAQYDPATRLPAGFVPPLDMIWNGPVRAAVAARPAGSLDFAAFFAGLAEKVDPERLRKALAMLRKEAFQLFAATSASALAGVVRSQSDGERVYSCRLASDGAYCCATQNLAPCGGLRGGLCKHLLVLVVGLTRTGDLDSATVDAWIDASRSRKAVLDRVALGETFARYRAAQKSEVDWRPTQTVPMEFEAL